MRAEIRPSRLGGCVNAPPSKSAAHRALITAAFAEGESRLCGISESADMAATIDCLRALGAEIEQIGRTAVVRGVRPQLVSAKNAEKNEEKPALPRLCCRESGSTLRFLLPAALLFGGAELCGSERLMERGVGIYRDLLQPRGVGFSACAQSITVCGSLSAGDFTLPGDVSSQFISGLLMALPLLPRTGERDGSRIILSTPAESRAYIDMTISTLRSVGAVIERAGDEFFIPCGQSYRPRAAAIEGDWSQAAFFFAMGDDVRVEGLDPESLQGDRAIVRLLADIRRGYTEADLADIPDLAPILFTAAAMGGCGARFSGTRRLAIKESRRADVMARELAKLGARVTVHPDSVEIAPARLHAPSVPFCSHGDHRVVMALTVAAARYGGVIEGAEAVGKSYPDFFADFAALGGDVSLHDEGGDGDNKKINKESEANANA